MKKVLVLLSAVAFVACFTSCNKECICREYAEGIEVDHYAVAVEEGKKCADMGIYTFDEQGNKTGLECK